jgi:ABC-type multidrug transport system fused ATPase/permease subunit
MCRRVRGLQTPLFVKVITKKLLFVALHLYSYTIVDIVFSRPFDEQRYRRVLHAAGLKPDLKLLARGDETEIGERGINVSGGQKS